MASPIDEPMVLRMDGSMDTHHGVVHGQKPMASSMDGSMGSLHDVLHGRAYGVVHGGLHGRSL